MLSDKGINKLIDKLEKYIVFIQYEYNGHVIKRPYTLKGDFLKDRKPSSSNTDTRIIEAWDMVEGKFSTIDGDDIVCYGIRNVGDEEESWIQSNRIIGGDLEKIKELDLGNMPDFINLYYRLDIDHNEIKLANDTCDLDACKQKWVDKIKTQISYALENLEEEEALARKEHDDEGLEEIIMIKELIDKIPQEAAQELTGCDSLHEIIEYWPPLLLPKPHYAKL